MSGSSIARSSTSARSDDRGQHRARRWWCSGSKASRWRSPPPSLPRCVVPRDVDQVRAPARGEVDDQHPLGADGAPTARRGCRRRPASPRSTSRTRSQSRSTSPMSCVVSSRVVPCVAPLGAQELAQPLLGQHVEADGRLVEDHQAGRVQQRGGDLGAHPLAQRELAHRRREELARARGGRPARRSARARRPADSAWMAARIRERLAHRQVPPQLGALAEDHADLARQAPPVGHRVAARRCVAVPAGRHQDAGEHLDRGRLAGAVGADVADRLARPRRSTSGRRPRRPCAGARPSRTLKSRPSASVR